MEKSDLQNNDIELLIVSYLTGSIREKRVDKAKRMDQCQRGEHEPFQ